MKHLGSGLSDMLDVGRNLEAVGGSNPAFIAWRSHAALALLQLGNAWPRWRCRANVSRNRPSALHAKTAEVHLSSAYRKLGISSRWQLPAVLAELARSL
jgi:hypothetical protein